MADYGESGNRWVVKEYLPIPSNQRVVQAYEVLDTKLQERQVVGKRAQDGLQDQAEIGNLSQDN
jgi:hypothetical protein